MPSEEMEVVVQKKKLDDLANIIAAKSGNDVPLTLDEMIDAAYDTASEPNLQKKTIKPTEKQQIIKADSGYDGLGEVEVGAISGTYVGSKIPRRDTLYQNNQYINAESGYYPNGAFIRLPTVDVATPSITVGSDGLITANTTQSSGYIRNTQNRSSELQLDTIGYTYFAANSSSQRIIPAGKYTTDDIYLAPINLAPEKTISPLEETQNITTDFAILSAFSDIFRDDALDGKKVKIYNYSTVSIGQEVMVNGMIMYVNDQGVSRLIADISHTFIKPQDAYTYTINESSYNKITITIDGAYISFTGNELTNSTCFLCNHHNNNYYISLWTRYNGLSSVTVNPIPSNYIGSAIPQKSSSDLTVSDNIVTAPSGYYAENASIHVSPTGDTFEVNALNIYNEGDYTAPSGTMYNSISVKTAPRIRFYDFDGTLLYDYSAAEIIANGTLPVTIAQSGLIAEGWNWSYQNVVDCLELYPDDDIEIGQICKSSDNLNHFFVDIPETNLALTLAFSSTTTISNASINFGDPVSNTFDYSNNSNYKTITHQYSTPGIYEVSFTYDMVLHSSYVRTSASTQEISSTTNCLNNSKEQMIIKYVPYDTRTYAYDTSISNSPFLNTTTITSFDLGTLYNCSGIQYIVVNSLGLGSFQGCTSLKKAILGYRTANFDTQSPHSVFRHCSNLTKVFLYPKTTAIPNGTFEYCNKLNKINDLYDLYTIGSYAFYQCSSLNRFFFPETLKTIDSSAFYNSGISEVYLSNIETLGSTCFAYCRQLQTVIITSEQLTIIPTSCFSNCDKLYNVTLPSSITTIRSEAFKFCGFTHISLPNSLQNVGSYAFSNCPYLQSIEFANAITQIEIGCFQGCTLLKKIVIRNNTPPSIGSNVFDIVSGMKIYVPASAVEAYKTATNWSTYADYIEAIPE